MKINSRDNIRLGVFYRSPNQKNEIIDYDLLCEIKSGYTANCLIIGDFNLPNID